MIAALAPFVIPDARKTVLSFFSCRMFSLAQLSTVYTYRVLGIFFRSFFTLATNRKQGAYYSFWMKLWLSTKTLMRCKIPHSSPVFIAVGILLAIFITENAWVSHKYVNYTYKQFWFTLLVSLCFDWKIQLIFYQRSALTFAFKCIHCKYHIIQLPLPDKHYTFCDYSLK